MLPKVSRSEHVLRLKSGIHTIAGSGDRVKEFVNNAREFNSTTKDLFAGVKGYLKYCKQGNQDHFACSYSLDGEHLGYPEGSKPVSPLPSRVIYVPATPADAPYLFETDGRCDDYVALSYCWGTDQVKTTAGTLASFRKALPSDISATVQDAITVTRELGFSYLWVDAFCIIQYDVEDWERESRRMGQIYMRAILTIVPVSASKCSEHFLSRQPISSVRIPFPLC